MLLEAYDIMSKVVFIPGAGREIGKGIARVLAVAGADIVLKALTSRYVESTAAHYWRPHTAYHRGRFHQGTCAGSGRGKNRWVKAMTVSKKAMTTGATTERWRTSRPDTPP